MKKTRVALVVDDALFMREVIRDALHPLFAQVHTAGTPDEALVLSERLQPDLITLDLTLDVQEAVQGLHLLAGLADRAPEARVVVVSAVNQPDVYEQARQQGAAACIAKPFEKAGLRSLAARILEENDGNH